MDIYRAENVKVGAENRRSKEEDIRRYDDGRAADRARTATREFTSPVSTETGDIGHITVDPQGINIRSLGATQGASDQSRSLVRGRSKIEGAKTATTTQAAGSDSSGFAVSSSGV